MLFVGYLEGFQSERSIAWHCADRMSLREFLGDQLHERTPDHSSFTIWRQSLPLEFYRAVFQRILSLMHWHGLIDAYAAGVDYQPSRATPLCVALPGRIAAPHTGSMTRN
ncbi:MAG: transposase [Thermodesulfobacteriota bacterium]